MKNKIAILVAVCVFIVSTFLVYMFIRNSLAGGAEATGPVKVR